MFSQSPFTILIVAITALVSLQAFGNSTLFRRLLLSPWRVKHEREYYRILSHTLVHADSFHLFFNLFSFWSFGSFLEQFFRNEELFRNFFQEIPFWGETRGIIYFLLLYVGGAVIATFPAMRRHGENPGYNAVGASGAVSAVMMAFMVMFPQFQVLFFFVIPCPAWVGAIIFLAAEHWMSRSGRTNIAHDAHIWGALYGLLFIAAINPEFIRLFALSVLTSLGLV